MKENADKHSDNLDFVEGDQVFFKLQPYVDNFGGYKESKTL